MHICRFFFWTQFKKKKNNDVVLGTNALYDIDKNDNYIKNSFHTNLK